MILSYGLSSVKRFGITLYNYEIWIINHGHYTTMWNGHDLLTWKCMLNTLWSFSCHFLLCLIYNMTHTDIQVHISVRLRLQTLHPAHLRVRLTLVLHLFIVFFSPCLFSFSQCKYTWFGPSTLCKANNHELKWHNAVQRFFKCQGCGIRSISFFRYPTKHCR